jgi:integrase/recombinase XerC
MELSEQIKDWNRKNKSNPLPRLPKEDAVVSSLETAHELDGNTTRQHLYNLRNVALLETLASTACRISEASSLKRADLVPEQMGAWVREGKGRKDRMIFFASEDSWDAVQAYLKERDKLGYKAVGEEPLFARHDRVSDHHAQLLPLTPNSMRWALNRLQPKGHFTPHQLRHRAATNLLRKTGNLEMVKDYLGHADIGTTANTYTHLDNTDLIKALRD